MQELFHRHRRHHRRIVLFIGLFVLLFSTIGVAAGLGMRPVGILFVAVLFVLVGLIMEAVFEHH